MSNSETPEELTDWELIQDSTFHPPSSPITDVFPPTDHEGLQIPPTPSSSPAPMPSSPTDGGSSGGQLSVISEIGTKIRLQICNLKRKIVARFAFGFGHHFVNRGRSGSVIAAGGLVMALVLSIVYVKVLQWRERAWDNARNRLLLLIRERDQKISQLLLQIAEMNEKLSERRRVPVIRITAG